MGRSLEECDVNRSSTEREPRSPDANGVPRPLNIWMTTTDESPVFFWFFIFEVLNMDECS